MTLRPSKHAHPDQTVISVALNMLERLKVKRILSFDDLRKDVKSHIRGGDVLFLPALNFLYVLGLIEYHAKNDSFEYVGQNEAL